MGILPGLINKLHKPKIMNAVGVTPKSWEYDRAYMIIECHCKSDKVDTYGYWGELCPYQPRDYVWRIDIVDGARYCVVSRNFGDFCEVLRQGI